MNFDPLSSSVEERSVEQQRHDLMERKRAKDDFLEIMRSKAGRRFMWDLLARAGVFWSTYNPKSENAALDMAFSEGRKQLGYELLGTINELCPNLYNVMVEEQKDYERTTSTNRGTTGADGTRNSATGAGRDTTG